MSSRHAITLAALTCMLGCDGRFESSAVDSGSPADASADASARDASSDAASAPDVSNPLDAARDADTRDAPDPADAQVASDTGAQDAAQDMGGPRGPLKAFPAAYGAGAEVTGGRGGVLIVVNTADPRAPLTHYPANASTPERYEGGFYAALQHDGPAYVVFDRSMNIDLGVRGTGAVDGGAGGLPDVNDKTVFGQSAPRGGVTLTGGTFRLSGRFGDATNLIFRYFRSRPVQNRDGVVNTDDDAYTWGLLFYGGNDVIVDHCSFAFASDKAMGAFIDQNVTPDYRMERFTFSRNQLGESHTSHYVEINPGRPEDPEEAVDDFSMLANLTVGMNRTPNMAYDGFAEVVNTVNYGLMSKQSTIYHDIRLNHVANYHAKSTERTDVPFNRVFTYDDSVPSVYTAGNYYQGVLDGTAGEDNRQIWRNESPALVDARHFVDAPFDSGHAHPYAPLTAAEAFASVVTDGDVGAYQYIDDDGRPQVYRDPFDASQLEVVRTGGVYRISDVTNWVLPVIPQSVRPGSYDTDEDGMADAWELRTFGDLSESYDGDHDNDGYTNIEEFMNQVDG